MNRTSHIVEFWTMPVAEVRVEHQPKEVQCADEAINWFEQGNKLIRSDR